MNTTQQRPADDVAVPETATCTKMHAGCCHDVINTYRCNQRSFGASDLWALRKRRRR